MNHSGHKHLGIVAVLIGTLATAGAANGGTSSLVSHTFGSPGTLPKLAANCSRLPMTLTPAGKTVAELKRFVFQTLVVQDAELKCEHRRVNRILHCASQPLPAGDPQVSLWRSDDWRFVDQFQAFTDGWEAAQSSIDTCIA